MAKKRGNTIYSHNELSCREKGFKTSRAPPKYFEHPHLATLSFSSNDDIFKSHCSIFLIQLLRLISSGTTDSFTKWKTYRTLMIAPLCETTRSFSINSDLSIERKDPERHSKTWSEMSLTFDNYCTSCELCFCSKRLTSDKYVTLPHTRKLDLSKRSS